MSTVTIADALQLIRPGAKWALRGDSYDGLEWMDATHAKPSANEVDAALDDVRLLRSRAAVKLEAQRRIIALTGKNTLQDCMIKQFNALMRAGQLTDKRVNGEALTAGEETEADALRALADRVKAIRAASDTIEVMSPIPADYTDNRWWPA